MDEGRLGETWQPALAALLVVAVTSAACGEGAVSDSSRDVPQGGTAFDASSDGPSSPTDPPVKAGGDAGAAADADGGPTANPRAVQMQDVTILLPLPKSLAERDSAMLKPSDPGRGGPIYEEALSLAVGGEDGNGGAWGCIGGCRPIVYDDLRLVGVRIDPCFAHTEAFDTGPACENQLRLVFQQVLADTDAGSALEAVEGNIHLFFSLTRAEVMTIVSTIVDLRIASGRSDQLGPLTVHPIAASEGLAGPFVRGLYSLIQAHAGPDNLIQVARVRGPLQSTWDFSAFDIVGAVPTLRLIPSLRTDRPPLGIAQEFSGDWSTNHSFYGTFDFNELSADKIDIIASYGACSLATPEARQASYDAALRVENPRYHTPNSIDCATCHASAFVRSVVGPEFGLSETGNSNLFQLSSPFVSAADMQSTTAINPAKPVANLHLFSYLKTFPSIAPRVINETALIVDYLNSTAK